MDLLSAIARPVVALFVALLVFGVLERIFRADRAGMPFRRKGFATDLAWWMTTSVVTRVVTKVGVGLAVFALAWWTTGRPLRDAELLAFVARDTWAAALPAPIEWLLTLIAADLIGYWIHRAFHLGWLWKVHAVHHSSERLDWLAAVRNHPLNDLLAGVVRIVLLVLLGFRPLVLAGVVPALTLYAIVLHANVGWTFGPLRRVIASPMFHRHHHARDVDGEGVNFGGLLAVWDVLFGTFQAPTTSLLPATGVRDPIPPSFLGQLAYPFRRGALKA